MENIDIKINCHSSICINGDVYIDPYNISEVKKNAKCIFITHPHYDHLDMPSIKNIATADTIIVGTKDSIDMLKEEGYDDDNLKVIKAGFEGCAYDINYSTFLSYNLNKKFHPKENGWVGYTLDVNGTKVTVCGDSDNTPELRNIKTDILLVPVGGTYTMTAKEAAELCNTIKPKLAIPTHYGFIVGNKTDGKDFCDNVKGIETQDIIAKEK